MNEECEYKDIKGYKSAFECFKQRFLVEKKSIFDLSDLDTNCDDEEESKNKDCCILTHENINYLIENAQNCYIIYEYIFCTLPITSNVVCVCTQGPYSLMVVCLKNGRNTGTTFLRLKCNSQMGIRLRHLKRWRRFSAGHTPKIVT